MFFGRRRTKRQVSIIEMTIDHDGQNWILYDQNIRIAAKKLEEMDRKLETAMKSRWEREGRLHVLMRTDNTIIPEWMRPFMNHYFNRQLELPLQY
ncbi:MAG: hypothetical protein CSA20_00675 [Deltaproteobacteria bacterium]|nr:MAG: hypothetical protein CSA20_00675 [Deltaproteobacteria bacterium]